MGKYDPLADLIHHPKKSWRDDKGTIVGISGGIQVSPVADFIRINFYGENDNSVYQATGKAGVELLLSALSAEKTDFVHDGVRVKVITRNGVVTINAGDANYVGVVTVVLDNSQLSLLIELLESAIKR